MYISIDPKFIPIDSDSQFYIFACFNHFSMNASTFVS